jgi:hypothetical protein
MARIEGNVAKEFAVIKFHTDNTYSTCSRKHKVDDHEGFIVGEQVMFKWSRTKTFDGIVVFADGKQSYQLLEPTILLHFHYSSIPQ